MHTLNPRVYTHTHRLKLKIRFLRNEEGASAKCQLPPRLDNSCRDISNAPLFDASNVTGMWNYKFCVGAGLYSTLFKEYS